MRRADLFNYEILPAFCSNHELELPLDISQVPFEQAHSYSEELRARMIGLKASSVLSHFYIALPSLGSKEGEEEKKLIFYYPPEDSIDTKVQNIGFAEAVIQFTSEFARKAKGEGACQSDGDEPPPHFQVATGKQSHIYIMVEEDYIFGAAFSKIKAAEAKEGKLIMLNILGAGRNKRREESVGGSRSEESFGE